jgi:hypothetical protein
MGERAGPSGQTPVAAAVRPRNVAAFRLRVNGGVHRMFTAVDERPRRRSRPRRSPAAAIAHVARGSYRGLLGGATRLAAAGSLTFPSAYASNSARDRALIVATPCA